MSLWNYKPKTKPALWQTAFPSQVKAQLKPISPKKVWRGIAMAPPARQKRIRHRSDAGRKADAIYAKAKREWWKQAKDGICPVMKLIFGKTVPVSKYPHHIRGRSGPLLYNPKFFLAVSPEGHEWIHKNICEAREKGWLANRGEWNKKE